MSVAPNFAASVTISRNDASRMDASTSSAVVVVVDEQLRGILLE